MSGFFLVLPLLLIIVVGNFLRLRGFFDEHDVGTLSKTLFWVLLPPLLFRTTYNVGGELFTQKKIFAAVTIAYLVTVAFVWLTASALVHKGNRKRVAVSVMASMRSNNMYLGFPVIQLAMGEPGYHYASLAFAVSIVSYQLISTGAGEMSLTGRCDPASVKKMLWNLARNPMILSCVLGTGLGMMLGKMPKALDDTMSLMSAACTAIGLLALGADLNIASLGRVLKIFRDTWYDIIVKGLAHPLLMWGLLLLFGVEGPLLKVSVMLSAMPAAVNCFIMAKEMGMDDGYAADLVASTTVFGAVSIPLWAMLLGIVS